MNAFPFSFLFPVIFIAVLTGVLVVYNRKQAKARRSFDELARKYQGAVSTKSLMAGYVFEGQQDGMMFSCRFSAGSKNSPPSLTVTVRAPFPARLSLRRKAWYDRFALRIGLTAEIPSGDPAFDQAYYLDTDRGDLLQSYFSQDDKRRAVDALMNLGYPVRKMVFSPNDIGLVLSPFSVDAITAFPLEPCLRELRNLSGSPAPAGYTASNALRSIPGGPRPPINRAGLTGLYLCNGLLIAGGIFALAYGMTMHEPVGHGLIASALLASVPAALLYLAVVFHWIRGRSSSHRHFLIILLLSLAGFPLGMAGGALTTNGLWDQGAETSHRVLITNRHSTQNKNSKTYHLAFSSWQQPGQTDEITVPLTLFRVIRQGDAMMIRTKPGYWREEWITGMEPAPETLNRPDAPAVSTLSFKSVQFYEGAPSAAQEETKTYATQFAGASSRYIYCRVNMENNLWQTQDRAYTFKWQFLNPDGSRRGEVVRPFTVRKDWWTAWITQSWGWEAPGQWPAGTYRVIVLVDDRPFGEGTFIIR